MPHIRSALAAFFVGLTAMSAYAGLVTHVNASGAEKGYVACGDAAFFDHLHVGPGLTERESRVSGSFVGFELTNEAEVDDLAATLRTIVSLTADVYVGVVARDFDRDAVEVADRRHGRDRGGEERLGSVPVPGTAALAGLGLMALAFVRRRRSETTA
jgi:hypothetical protein